MRDLIRYAKWWALAALFGRLVLLIAVLVMLAMFISGGGSVHLTWSVGNG